MSAKSPLNVSEFRGSAVEALSETGLEPYHYTSMHIFMGELLYQALSGELAKVSLGRKRQGICGELDRLMHSIEDRTMIGVDMIALVDYLAKRWPQSSGRMYYPIPATHGNSAVMAYSDHHISNTLWTGEQLKLRISLLRYMRKRMRDLIRRHSF